MSSKAKSDIAKDKARACAHDLILSLRRSADEAKNQVMELVEQYTAGARTVIIFQALDLINGKDQDKFDEGVIELLIRSFITNQKTRGLEKLILSLADFTAVALASRSNGWALGVAAVNLGNSKEGLANKHAFTLIGEKLRNDEDHLDESLAHIVESGASPWAVQLWECMALPAVGNLSRPYSITQKGSSRIIAVLSKMESKAYSESLPLIIPMFLNHANPDSQERFLATSIGRLFQKNVISADRKSGRSQVQAPDFLLGEDDRQLLHLVREWLLAKNQKSDSVLENAESKYAEKQADYQNRLRQVNSENSRLSDQLQKSQDNVSQFESDMEKYRIEINTKDEDLARQASEIRHLNREKRNQETDQIERHHEALQKKLIEPAATVRDLVIEICSPEGNSKIEQRSLAVAFDTLHRRILKLAKADDYRIPVKILSGGKE